MQLDLDDVAVVMADLVKQELAPLRAENLALRERLGVLEKREAIQPRDGVPGSQGLQGERGLQGEVGPQGAIGPQGEVGPQGVPGTDGKDGKDADPALIGQLVNEAVAKIPVLKGEPGEPGPKGEPGLPGPIGEKGLDGRDGLTAMLPAVATVMREFFDSRVQPIVARIEAVERAQGTVAEPPAEPAPMSEEQEDELVKTAAMLLRNELALVGGYTARVQKRIVRDAEGKIESIIEEPAA